MQFEVFVLFAVLMMHQSVCWNQSHFIYAAASIQVNVVQSASQLIDRLIIRQNKWQYKEKEYKWWEKNKGQITNWDQCTQEKISDKNV